jgi:signal transduction histidine kinase
MNVLSNLDLLSVGLTIAGIGILGFVIYFNNPKSITSRSFLFFSITSILWGIANYINYKFTSETAILWTLRIAIFLAVWHAFSLFQLLYVFPKKEFKFSKLYKYTLVPLVSITSLILLTPIAFVKVTKLATPGEVSIVAKGPGMIAFILLIIFLVSTAFYVLLKKINNAKDNAKTQATMVFIGLLITFALIITFNFLLPALFDIVKLIPLGAIFILPFILFTSYAILKHKLFDIKVITTAIMAFVLSIVTFLEIIFSEGLDQIIFRSSVFILVLVFSVFLLKSVRKEVVQRQQIEKLADTLAKANVRLKELDKMKSEFVSFATHQIRAPITAIKGYTSLILEGSYGEVSSEMKEAIDRIYKSSQSLAIVVEDYLNISRIEMGRMKYNFKVLDFGKLIREIAEELKPTVLKAKLEILIDIDDSKEYKAKMDEGKMRQVDTKKGSIKISLSKDEKRNKLIAQISDTGIGIEKETMPKLFKKFSRAKDANDTNIHGTGVGLYIAKVMAEAHDGGRIWAESEGEGKGSQFYIEVDSI